MNRYVWILVSSFLVSFFAQANDTVAKLLQTEDFPKPIKQVHPKYPTNQARAGNEGWVKLSYVVSKDGSVKDIVLLDSAGGRDFEREAKRALSKWEFQPAVRNNEPVEQCNTVQLDFSISNSSGTVSRREKPAIDLGLAGIRENDIAKISESLDSLSKQSLSVNGFQWSKYIASFKHKSEGDLLSYYRALKYISPNRITDEVAYWALQERFIYEVQNFLYFDALKTFETISKGKTEYAKRLTASFLPYQKRIIDQVEGVNIIPIDAKITKYKSWRHQLVRKAFSIQDISGELNQLEVRCRYKKRVFNVVENNRWDIPESWGQCNVLVQGNEGTSFTLIELPKA
jgi:TonB family protein